jgi:probable rRNA maturation factor
MRVPEIAIIVEAGEWPPEAALRDLAERAIAATIAAIGEAELRSGKKGERAGAITGELSIVFTDDAAIRRLNRSWRGKDQPTNVLSFPQEPANPQESGALIGDIVLAAETVAREAALAGKPFQDHIAHLLVHGFLHLLGWDHAVDDDAEKMEELERVALKRLGIADPYAAP